MQNEEQVSLGSFEVESYTTEFEVEIEAPRERVWRAYTGEIDRWWPHSFYPDSEVHLELEPGGYFREVLPDSGFALYARVQHVRPLEYLELRGPMGMQNAVATVYRGWFEETADGHTVLRSASSVFGELDMDQVRAYKEEGHRIINTYLRQWVERESPVDRAELHRQMREAREEAAG